MRRIVSLVAVALVASGCAGVARGGAGSAPLEGVVYSAGGIPLSGVEIDLVGTTPVVSDLNGRFTLPDVAFGAHRVVARRDGFEEADAGIRFDRPTDVLYLRLHSVADLLAAAQREIDRGRLSVAAELIRRAQAIAPDDPAARYLAAIALTEEGRFEQARAVLGTITDDRNRTAVDLLRARIDEEARR